MDDVFEKLFAELEESNRRLRADVEAAREELAATKKELQRTVARTSVFLDTTVDAVVTVSSGGQIESFNPAAERLFGFKAAEIIGRNASLLMPPPHDREHDGYIERYLKTGQRRIIGIGREVQARRKNGESFPIHLYVGEFHDGENQGFVGIVRDVTEAKSAEKRIIEQASLLDKVHEAVLIQDLSGHLLFWNQGAERIYGWKAEAVVGGDVAGVVFQSIPADHALAMREVLEKGAFRGEFHQRSKDGAPLIVDSHWSLLRDKDGAPRAVVVINIDVTQRKKLEQQFRRAQRLESIGTLASGIAHDLNNLLTPILLSTKLLRRDRPEEQRLELLDTVAASAHRASAMVKRLLSFAGGVEGERAPLDIGQVIEEVRRLVENALPKSIELVVQVDKDHDAILGDATQLSQVLMNLIINSRDAMPNGGALRISVENRTLSEQQAKSFAEGKAGRYVLLSVRDEGIGISPQNLERVFDPFFTTKESGKGTGLGLSTVRGIVKGHDGFVNIYSEVGKGTRVDAYLPAAQGLADGRRSDEPFPRGRGETILLVDDEEMMRLAAERTLSEHGYRTILAANGDEALAVFNDRQGDIDAVLMDMMMPGMDGVTAIRLLRKLAPVLPIIAMSGIHSRGRNSDAMAAGARLFLQKPYSDRQLLLALAEIFTKKTTDDATGDPPPR